MSVIRHLALRCRDMEVSRRFYETAFGWEFLGYRPSGGGLDFSDGLLNITMIQQPADCNRPTLAEGNEYIHFGVIVEDLQGCWGRLQSLGAELAGDAVKDDQRTTDGDLPTRSFKVLDPDGNVIDVTCATDEWRGVKR